MAKKCDIDEQLKKLNGYAPSELLGYLYDTLQSNKNYVMGIGQIYIVTLILNEQIRRNLINGGQTRNHNSHQFRQN